VSYDRICLRDRSTLDHAHLTLLPAVCLSVRLSVCLSVCLVAFNNSSFDVLAVVIFISATSYYDVVKRLQVRQTC